MAESLGDIKITASTDAEAKALVQMLQGKGIQGIGKLMGGTPGKEKYMVSGRGTAGQIQSALGTGIPSGSKYMANLPESSVNAGMSVFDRLKATFTSKNMKDINKSLFILQMSSLGVAFSFSGIINQVMGLFSGLQDLGTLISTGAIGTTFAGIATGGKDTTDIASTFGVTPEMQTAAWAGFTAIVSQFTAVFNALAVKVLTPDMVAAILSVIDALADTLAKPEVAQAIQEIVKSVLQITLAVLPLVPVIADLITWLGETGLMRTILMIIVAAEILLPTLAYIQFWFTALMTVVELLAAAASILSVPLWAIIGVVLIILTVVDVLIHFFENLASGMDVVSAFTTALGQTFADFANIIIGIYNAIASLVGMGKVAYLSTENANDSDATKNANTVVNNYNFNKNVGTNSASEVTDALKKANASSMG